MEKETLEEAAEKYATTNKTYSEQSELDFKAGAYWQQERMYSEEEVRQMLFDLGDALFNNCQNGIEEGESEKYFDVIIEQFRKK